MMNNKLVAALIQQIDKIVLVIALGVGGFLVWAYSMGEPYAVPIKVGKTSEVVSPAAVTDRVLNQANRLRQQLSSDRVPEALADFTIPDYTQDFLQRLDRSLAVAAGVSMPLAQVGISTADIASESLEDIEYVVPTPPAAVSVVARAGNAVLDDQISPGQLEPIVARVGDRVPRDFHYVSVAGQLDLDAWMRRMDSVNDGRALPAAWQRSALYAVDIRLERQQWLPDQGVWGPTQLIQPIPGQVSYREASVGSRSEADVLHGAITAQQEQILRPAFLPLARGQGPPWRAPDEADAVLDAAEHEKLAQLNRDIERLTRRIETMERTLERRPASDGDSRRDTRTPSSPPGFVDPNEALRVPSGAGGIPSGSARPRVERLTPEQQLAQMQEERDQKLVERDALLRPVRKGFESATPDGVADRGRTAQREPGVAPSLESLDAIAAQMFADQFAPTSGTGSPARSRPAAAVTAPEEEESQKLRFWVHDIDVEPGATYRYRVVVDMLNPLFRRQQSLAVEQKAQADVVAIQAEPSGWTNAVEVDPFVRFFLVGASSTQETAEIEVYRLYAGVQRSQTFTGVKPGDMIGQPRTLRIGGQSMRIDFSTHKALVDLEDAAQLDEAGSDTRGLFSDLADGRLFERWARRDANDPTRARYQNDTVLWAALPDGNP